MGRCQESADDLGALVGAVPGLQLLIMRGDGRPGTGVVEGWTGAAPDLVVLDVPSSPAPVSTCRELARRWRTARLVAVLDELDGWTALDLLAAGVRGLVMRSQARTEIGHAIAAVSRGAVYLDSEVAGHAFGEWLSATLGRPAPVPADCRVPPYLVTV